jgi:enhancing lycopene biosynthesis protein 2
MKKIGVLLSGCGVYDGAEIQEAVFTLLAIEELGAEAVCIGIDKNQHHVVNHTNGEEMQESRNMLVEAARIARGKITSIDKIEPNDIDALVIPGGFGSAKNFTTWAFDGPNSTILPEVKLLLVNLVNIGTPICALCVSPVVVAKALADSTTHAHLTIGSVTVNKSISEIQIDHKNRIVSAPCYMMETTLVELRQNIFQAVEATIQLID